MRPARGAALIGALLLIVVVFVLGVAFLTRQVMAYRGARLTREGYLARALAEAGLEDARLKLEKDLNFPPASDPTQLTFTWSEDFPDVSGSIVGSYTVTVDRTYLPEPNFIWQVTSVGRYGRRGGPTTNQTLFAEIDAARQLRTDDTLKNPQVFRFLRLEHR